MTNSNSDRTTGLRFGAEVWSFVRDFAAFSGRTGMVAIVFVTLGALLEGLSLILLVPLLAVLIGSALPSGKLAQAAARLFDFFSIERPFSQLTLLLVLFGALMLLRALVLYIRDVLVAKLQASFVEGQRLRAAESLAAASWHQIVRLRYARVMQLMSDDIQSVGTASFVLLRSVVATAMLLAQCGLIFLLAPVLALIALGFFAISALALMPIIRRAHAFGAFVTDTNLSLMNTATQFLGGLKLAISQNLQASFVAEFRESLHKLTRRQIAFSRQQTSNRLALSTLSAFAGGLLVLVGFGVFNVDPATLIALLLIIARMSGPAGQIQQGVQQLAHALPVYGKVKALERELTAIPHDQSVRVDFAPALDGPIVFENVYFNYAADDGEGSLVRGLRGLNLRIEPGAFLGISGASGAGKTTFLDLLVGLYSPQQGRIVVGGVPLEGAVLASWRDCISYVSQDPFLFHDTVRRNLAWAAPQTSELEMWNALGLAGATELVRSMPQGLETMTGERGTLVSGGERQRISLARAILRKPRLLILDEATSAIDIEGERKILQRLHGLTPQPTVVIVAHRAQTLGLCDRVVRFEAGRCIE